MRGFGRSGSTTQRLCQLIAGAGAIAIGTTYGAYPVAMRAAAWCRQHGHRPSRPSGDDAIDRSALPRLTVVVPAFNEAEFIDKKLHELRLQDYPADLLDIVVVDDGSTDGTPELAAASGTDVRVLIRPERGGKCQALDDAVAAARGEVVVFTDANASLTPGALLAVARQFADARVAVTTGAKAPSGAGAHGSGESLYWRMESGLKAAESTFGCAMGADGGIYAVRRATFRPIPPDVYADDYWLPLDALERGLAVTQAPGVVAAEAVAGTKRDDFERRARIAAGIWQVSLSHLTLADPRRGMVAVSFVAHRLLRSIVVPVMLVLTLPASAVAARHSRVMRALAWAQVAGYVGAALGATTNLRPCAVPYEFTLTNAAALRGGFRHLRHRQSVLWASTSRGEWNDAVDRTAED